MDPLVERAKRGDREAMAELVRRNYDAVYRFCARRVGLEPAKDMAQETFLTACRSLRRYEGRSSFEVWLFGIAHNLCRRSLRSSAPVNVEAAWRTEPDTEESWIDRRVLVEALRGLSAEHLEAVLLHEVEGLTYEEAAQVLGVPTGTVKSRLHHAFARLRSSLQAQGVNR
ncbi:MAG: sigma-70 family RNA polymerase sigma factor [Armatimonadetes bacterium]|nr:sigma-70 family RNA polymerase sigma factor [Armatimonadota bacterium]MCA1995669.1 sigma-70 family RNA polymerase sigma factor [Armatimonadota bacterium]